MSFLDSTKHGYQLTGSRTKGMSSISGIKNKDDKPRCIDTLIVGGGPVGASTAFHLAIQRRGQYPFSLAESNCKNGDVSDNDDDVTDPSILVVERDPSYQSGSAIFSAGGIRVHFSLEENVRMSLYGMHFLRNSSTILSSTPSPPSAVDVQYTENGYLLLASSETGEKQLRENYAMYQRVGCSDRVELLSPEELGIRFPWLNKNDIRLGSFGCKGEGWFDPWGYIQGLNEKNKAMGVRYEKGTVVGATRDLQSGKIISVRIQDKATSEVYDVQVTTVVNAAGAASDEVLDNLGGGSAGDDTDRNMSRSLLYPFPVRPRKRSIYFFHCQKPFSSSHNEGDPIIPDMAPLTIDPTGAYFRSEGTRTGNFLCGISPPSDEDHDCYDRRELVNADPHLFDRYIWPALYHRVPAFGSIKVQSSWAGLYEYNTVDQNCIIDFHPEMNNVLMINGFSGHGLQHSPAAGRAGAELIDYANRFVSLNLDVFRFDRFMEGGRGPVLEKGIY